jgi:hypothetical protein
MTTMAITPRPVRLPRPTGLGGKLPERPIVTRAEQAECTCPEACERDHEWD